MSHNWADKVARKLFMMVKWLVPKQSRILGIKMNIFIGNLSYNVTEADLRDAFEVYGQVVSATVIKDKQSGRSKGFGYVEMPVQAEAQSAIAALNGKSLNNRTITVNEARPHPGSRRSEDRAGDGDRRGGGRSY
jgi:RNA recognition motif-containing protein